MMFEKKVFFNEQIVILLHCQIVETISINRIDTLSERSGDDLL